MKFRKSVWWLHKFLSYFVFLQVFFWVLGGIYFATVPFKPLVKGGDFVASPAAPVLPVGWGRLQAQYPDVQSLTAVPSAQGALVKLQQPDGAIWLTATGQPAVKVSPAQVATYAQQLYLGAPGAPAVRWLAQTEPRLWGLVDEASGRTGIWQASFDEGVRLYFGAHGNFLLVRTDYWVWYDALWRLHIMDYGEGEDFNNGLLRAFAWLAFFFVLTGLAMSYFAFQRSAKHLKKTL